MHYSQYLLSIRVFCLNTCVKRKKCYYEMIFNFNFLFDFVKYLPFGGTILINAELFCLEYRNTEFALNIFFFNFNISIVYLTVSFTIGIFKDFWWFCCGATDCHQYNSNQHYETEPCWVLHSPHFIQIFFMVILFSERFKIKLSYNFFFACIKYGKFINRL